MCAFEGKPFSDVASLYNEEGGASGNFKTCSIR
jgi:hypothetical protein